MQGEYPSDEDLERLKSWPITKRSHVLDAINFAVDLWNQNYGRAEWVDGKLELATGGWSGNESVIDAMGSNFLLWSQAWLLSKRGGLHVFEVRQ